MNRGSVKEKEERERRGEKRKDAEGGVFSANLRGVVVVVSVLVVIAASAITVAQLPPTPPESPTSSPAISESGNGSDGNLTEAPLTENESAAENESSADLTPPPSEGADERDAGAFVAMSDITILQGGAEMEVNKTVWDPVNGMWVDEICCAKICDNYRFNVTIHNTGTVALQNITFWDIASCSLEHADTNITVCYETTCYNITPDMLPPYPFRPKILHPFNLSWDPQNPVCNEFEELCPESNKIHIVEWEDNGDSILSHCDQINMTDETGNSSWYHVERLPYTLKVTNVETGETTYFDSELDYQDIDLTNPNGTQWKEVCYCKDSYNLTWYDTNSDGVLNASDHILMQNRRTGEITEYHVEEVTIDLVVSKEWRIDDYYPGFVLPPDGRLHIEADAHVIDCGHDCNTVYVKARPEGGGDWIYANDSACINVCCIEVDKKVWNGSAWVDGTAAELNDTVRFKIYVHNNGACNFTNIVVRDILSDSLNYSDEATVNGVPQEPDQTGPNEYEWSFSGLLEPCQNITIEFNATVVKCPGVDTNTVNVTAECDGTTVFAEDSAKVAVIPKPFLIYGWVFNTTNQPLLNPNVTVKNLNTSEEYDVETNASYNYYQVVTSSCNVSVGDLIYFNASDGVNSTNYTVTVTQQNITDGGLFEQNISLYQAPPGICGDVNRDGYITGYDSDLILLYLYKGYSLADKWAADVNCDGYITGYDSDLILLYLYKGYELNCCR